MNTHDKEIFKRLVQEYTDAKIALDFQSHFQLLVAVILSAQCTDVRVNFVTPALFEKYPDAWSMAEADVEDVKRIIFSTGFYNNKAKNIVAASKMIVSEFDGKLQDNMSDMLRLAGVARKTANVVLAELTGVAFGIVVDTHVMRISRRLGFVKEEIALKKNAVLIEKELMNVIDKKYWRMLPHYLIFHGRKVCKARRPLCRECFLVDLCQSSDRVV